MLINIKEKEIKKLITKKQNNKGETTKELSCTFLNVEDLLDNLDITFIDWVLKFLNFTEEEYNKIITNEYYVEINGYPENDRIVSYEELRGMREIFTDEAKIKIIKLSNYYLKSFYRLEEDAPVFQIFMNATIKIDLLEIIEDNKIQLKAHIEELEHTRGEN